MKHYSTMHVQVSLRGAFLVFLLVVFLFSAAQPVPVSAATCSGGYCAFLPILKSPAAGDLVIQGIEVTQAVQDPANSVPLVAGRNTLLRIYARAVGASQPISNVKISVSASGGYNLNDLPRAYSTTVPLSYDRMNINGSINITLPKTWTEGTVTLTVRLDPDNQIGEVSEGNNGITQQFVFQPVPPLQVKIVPIKYVNEKDGYTYPAPTRDTISDWILRTYPVPSVDVTWHAAYTFKGNLTQASEFGRLLNEITALKSSEHSPEEVVYYALVPTSGSGRTWFHGGVAGIGWIGLRAAVGLELASSGGEIAAHEIGHNMGLEHSPCGLLSSANTNYPYDDGSIGQLGTDTYAGVIYPSSTKDVMSYCSPKWVSDYTYRVLFKTQRLQGAMYSLAAAPVQSQRGLLVRAEISDAGVDLKPAYVMPGAVERMPEAGDYLLETLDEQGAVVTQTPLRAYEAMSEEGVLFASMNVLVPLPDTPVASFRLVKDGQVLAAQTLQAAGDMAQSPALNAAAENQPALVRYSTDGGVTWTTLGIDLTGEDLPSVLEENVIYQVLTSGTWR